MTLEVLFAQQGQAETFLRMVLLGAAFALALTLGGAWRHRHGLSDAADVLCALMLTLAALIVLIHSGEGLRLYALLGLLLGAVLIAGYVLLMASFGLFVGLKMPNLHWTNEITPIKEYAKS